MASRAIIHDLWWHKCAESQAFGRIHRIGQTRRVRTVKVVANDDADARCLELQEEKEGDIAKVQRGGSGATLSGKQTRKLMKLGDKNDEETDESEDECSEKECSDEENEYDESETESSDGDTSVAAGASGDEWLPH